MSTKTIRNLRIEHFQSHELTEMAFDDGLNVIVGPSDSGKSAVIRALRWLLFNEPRGSDFMRVGHNNVRVSIELADGARVTRERTPSKNRYIVVNTEGEEQIYEGFGNSVPQEVIDVTGVAKVMLDEDTETVLHLGTQLEPAFLLAEPGSIKAKAIGRLNGVHIIDAASRDTHRDLTRLTQEEKQYREQLAEVEEELEQFSDLPYLENILLLVEMKQAELKALHARREKLQTLHQKYKATRADLALTDEILSRTEHLDRASLQAERAVTLQTKTLRLRQAAQKLAHVATGIEQTDRILAATGELDRAGDRLHTGEAKVARFRRLRTLADQRQQTNAVLQNVDRILHQTNGLDDAASRVTRLERSKHRLSTLTALAAKRSDTGGMLIKIDRILARTEPVAAAEQSLDVLAQKRAKANALRDLHNKKQDVERLLSRLGQIMTQLERAARAEDSLTRLQFLTDRQQRLMQMQNGLFDVTDRLKKADVYLHTNALELTQLIDEYSRELKQSASCPVCFTPIDEHTTERLLEEFRSF